MQLHGKVSPFATYTTGPVRRRTGASSGGGGGGGNYASGYLGPFPEYKGCPAGTIVAHRYGSGLNKMVQCKATGGPAPQVQAQAPAQIHNVFTPTVEVSPTIQTEVSPQISPVFQQTGSGDQSAGTSMTSAGGQKAGGGDPRTLEQIIQATLSAQAEADYRRRAKLDAQAAEEKRISDEKKAVQDLENLAQQQAQAQQQANEDAQRAAQFETERQRVELEQAQAQAQKDAEILASRADVPFPSQTSFASPSSAYAPSYGSPFESTKIDTSVISKETKADNMPLILAGSALVFGGIYYYITKS